MPASLEEVSREWYRFFDRVSDFLYEVRSLVEYYEDSNTHSTVVMKRKISNALKKYEHLRRNKWVNHPLFGTILAHMALVSKVLEYIKFILEEDDDAMPFIDAYISSFADPERELHGLFHYLKLLIGKVIDVLENEIFPQYVGAFYDMSVYEDEDESIEEE